MIVFIASFPALSNEQDGMVQRIVSIDSLVTNLPRIYLDIAFRKFWTRRTYHFGDATVFQLNAFLHFFTILSWCRKATVVYVHSVHNALRALPAYWITKPITDLHGVVPEELLYQGHICLARLLEWIERIALRRSDTVVFVTQAMKRHYQHKYGRQSLSDCVLPILPKITDSRGHRHNVLGGNRDSMAVIYAGGLQSWQNVSMMIDAVATATKFRYFFLTGESQTLQKLANLANMQNFTCVGVAPDKVPDYYLTCTYGFVLRDPVLVNQVACPTKLVEYLYWGVIPIVLSSNIGDFDNLGFSYVTLANFLADEMPNQNEVGRMRAKNRQLIEILIKSCEDNISTLSKVLHTGVVSSCRQ